MLLLHLHWLMPDTTGPGRLFVWAETTPAEPPARSRRRKGARPHPFAAAAALLDQLLDCSEEVEAASAELWLPSEPARPLPAPDLPVAWPAPAEPVTLERWQIEGLALTPAQAFAAFNNLYVEGPPPGFQLGPGTLYWQKAHSWLLSLLAAQLYRPVLVNPPGPVAAEARWQLVLDGEEEMAQATRLAAAQPAICRAAAADPEQPLPARALLDSFLNHLADAAIRLAAAASNHELPAGHDPAAVWSRALLAPEPAVKVSPEQLRHFQSSYNAWVRTLSIAGDKHFRIAFRLEAPPTAGAGRKNATWRLHYLLQARDDLSLLVPAAEVWQAQSELLARLDRQFRAPRERLLMGLGYAARFFDPIQQSLQEKQPDGASLDTAAAYAFLRDCAPQLQRAGFGLLVPPWWNKPGTHLGVRLQLSRQQAGSGANPAKGHLGLDNLVRYQWQLSLGETALSRAEFDALVALKSPLVALRGQWVQLDPAQIEAAIRFWQEQDWSGSLSPQEAIRLAALGAENEHEGLAVEAVELDEWLQAWLGQLQGDERLELLPPPAGLQAQLRPYQRYGYSWLHFARRWGMGVILADDMGLGKTIQTLTLIQQLKEEWGGLPAPLLLICPTSVVANWELEAARFTPGLRVLVHHGSDRLRVAEFAAAAQRQDLVLTSYALARRDAEILQAVDWSGVVLDEAQNIKNAQTKQARAIRGLSAGFRLALTGTPVENRLAELWSIMQFLNPGFLGSAKQFREQYTLPIEKYGDQGAAARLRQLTRPFLLRRVKTDPDVIQDLPDKQEMKVYCQLTTEQATLYEAVVRDALLAIEAQAEDGMARKGLVLSMLMQLKQICNHPAQYLHEAEAYRPASDRERSGKLARLHDLLDEILARGDRLLIFSQFTEMASLLQQYIREHFAVPTLYLHGGVPGKKRMQMVTQFQAENGPPVFLLSLKAGGTGLNLTRANHVFHFDRWWNPAVEDQATDRAFRIGQTKNVLVHKFVCQGTLEEKIDAMIAEKKALAEQIIGSGESWLTEMSTNDLRELVRLRQAAYAE
jgi:SNF2 family DNA or RNA helicase